MEDSFAKIALQHALKPYYDLAMAIMPAFIGSPSTRKMADYLKFINLKFGGPKTAFTPVSKLKDGYTCSNFALDPASSNSLAPAASIPFLNDVTNAPSNNRSYSNNSRLWCHKCRSNSDHTNNCHNNVNFVNLTYADEGSLENARAS